MNSIHIVTDSACDLTEEQAKALSITVVPLSIRFGADEFTDRVQLSADQFWTKMAAAPNLPETAAPSPGAFEQAYRQAAAAGATGIVCITISAALSATHQSATLAAKAVADTIDVHVIDSASITFGEGTMVLAAATAAAAGKSSDEVIQVVKRYLGHTFVYGTIDTLDNLRKGGRIGGARAMLGSLLSIKPLINVSTGSVEEAGKQRTRSKALAALVSFAAEAKAAHGSISNVAIMHGNATQADIDQVLDYLSPHCNRDEIHIGQIGAVIGTHGGPGIMGLTFVSPAETRSATAPSAN
jgi:DegV family protein with EDD domain